MSKRFNNYTLGELETAVRIIRATRIDALADLLDEIERRKVAARRHINMRTRIDIANNDVGPYTTTVGTFCRHNDIALPEIADALARTGKFVLDAGSNNDPDIHTVTLA